MFEWIKNNITAFIIAVVLHLIFLAALLVNWQMDKPRQIVLEQGDIIQTTSVDANSYDAKIKKIEEQKRAEKQRKAQAEQVAHERKEKKRREEMHRKQEKKRKAEEKRKKEKELKRKKAAEAKKKEEQRKEDLLKEKQRKESEQKAAEEKRQKEQKLKEKADRKKKAEQEKKRKEAEKKQKAEQEKKRREAEQKQKAEQEKKRQAELKRKEERERAEFLRKSKGIVNRHVAMIAQKIERNWRQPLNAPRDLQCKIDIVLQSNGNVISVKIAESSGNLSFDRSVETAVRKASPLPVPVDNVIFKQFEAMRLRFEPGNH